VAVGAAAHNADHFGHSKLVRALLVDFANIATYGSIWLVKFFLYNRFLFTGTDRTPGVEATTGEVIAAPAGEELEAVGVGAPRAS